MKLKLKLKLELETGIEFGTGVETWIAIGIGVETGMELIKTRTSSARVQKCVLFFHCLLLKKK